MEVKHEILLLKLNWNGMYCKSCLQLWEGKESWLLDGRTRDQIKEFGGTLVAKSLDKRKEAALKKKEENRQKQIAAAKAAVPAAPASRAAPSAADNRAAAFSRSAPLVHRSGPRPPPMFVRMPPPPGLAKT